jgi:hypothetical protein
LEPFGVHSGLQDNHPHQGRSGDKNMRYYAIALIAAAAFTASIETADARINCGPGMNSNGRGCVPIGARWDYGPRYYDGPQYYRHQYRPRYHMVDCGPGMNSNGNGQCVPIRHRYYRYY